MTITKISVLLFSALLLVAPTHAAPPRQLTSFTAFPAQHSDFLGEISYEAVFNDWPQGGDDSFSTGRAPPPITVGPNIQVNAPQQPFPNGLLGRSETTIAVGSDIMHMVAGWNDANGFLKEPFLVPAGIPGTPGLSGFAFSTNAGTSWTDTGPPPTYAATTPFFSGDVVSRGDPWLTTAKVNGHDTFYYANLGVFKQLDSSNNIVDAGVSVQRGTFVGTTFTWTDGHVLSAPNAPFDFYDKEAIAARQVNTQTIVAVSVTNFIGISTPGTNPNFCQFAGGFGQIEVWVSRDGGNTYQGPFVVGADITNTAADPNCFTGTLQQGSMPVIGPDGQVSVVWTKGPNYVNGVPDSSEAIVVASASGSDSSPPTFSTPSVVHSILASRHNPPVGYNRAEHNDFPRMAISDKGTLYVTYQDSTVAGNAGIGGSGTVCLPATGLPSPGPPCPTGQRRVKVGGGADSDVYLSRSNDNGATWSTPTLVNPTAGDGKIQFWPVVSVGAHGVVNVVYYESQEVHTNTANPNAIECSTRIGGGLARRSLRSSLVDTFIAQSTDGGTTFRPPVRVSSVTSNWCKATVNIRPNFGDYITSVSVGPLTFAVWADDRNTIPIGTPPTPRNVVDVMYATIGTIPGDVDGDFNVNIMDGAALAYAFDSHTGDPLWNLAADFAHTGTIGILDAAVLAAYYGTVA